MRYFAIRLWLCVLAVVLPAVAAAVAPDGRAAVLCVFGDSYVANHRCPAAETWHAKAASALGMHYANYGVNGSSVLFDRSAEGFGKAMTERYRELPASLDCLLIIAGHNDACLVRDDSALDDFRLALSSLLDGLRVRYPKAAIGYVLPWHVDRDYFDKVLLTIRDECRRHAVPVFDAEKAGGIRVNDPGFRKKYFQNGGVGDTAHLNARGHDRITDAGIRFIEGLMAGAMPSDGEDAVFLPAGRGLRLRLPSQREPVLDTAVEIFSSDMMTVLASDVVPVDADADIELSIDSEAVRRKEGFEIRITPRGVISIVGHDSHGAAYGLLELSRYAGVSPWEWWADAVPRQRDGLSVPMSFYVNSAPSVEYRGIFINDEDWGLMPWSCTTHDPQPHGVVGPKTSARIFELLLRLRANTYWPPMHECTQPFFLTEGNREMARKYGIYIGGSHCEPMACSTAGEWPRRGTGEYDYSSNADNVKAFWRARLDEVAGQEIIYTLGMRGVHDGAMVGAKGLGMQKALLSQVLADQREMLADYGIADAPQVFIPYKEVLDIYNSGLELPDDVTLMWCDDNYGYIRHFPDSTERVRPGGNGVYYHVSYWGRPHDYLWLGTFSPGLLYQQMSEAYRRGIDRMWILNVGDIKPAEYQIELFMDMAWNIGAVRRDGVRRHYRDFLAREFGPSAADRLLPLMQEHYRLAHIRRPEFMGMTRTEEARADYYDRIHDLPWSDAEIAGRLEAYGRLADAVEREESSVGRDRKETYFQLVKYPVQAAAMMNRKFLFGQLARHGKLGWELADAAYDSIQSLTAAYNTPKWNGIMDSHPRSMPVFRRLQADTCTCRAAMAVPRVVKELRASDGQGYRRRFEWLGYDDSAVEAGIGDSVVYAFSATLPESLLLEMAFLPTHSVDGRPLSFSLEVDGKQYGEISYSTEGRSEEWKENVLRNQAIRSLKVGFSDGPEHRIVLRPHSEVLVIDRLRLLDP